MKYTVRGWVWFVLGVVITLGVSWLMAGCATSLMRREPMTQSVHLHEPPDVAYQRAIRVMTRLGAEFTHADSEARVISARVHGAVVLNVSVDGESTVEVTGVVVPGKVVIGTMTEVQDFLALLDQGTK